ncbi:Fe-S cluster assembly sulfur transfer protein SufU [Luteimicrobium subarcticum]|uniref:Nitrogen fixation NifU-like protein n=1 Tax=Luteimicrobium subarcticum TaxID=620910 RepID=A0A2M8WWH4_9MICO|nr:SUF system NifU family Fe-S cluster assembly protein [Luteimicrobium subarcticum]PJI95271.1 nitrogen fixation NifU-like protein [Luteimicrobium subarcticum]
MTGPSALEQLYQQVILDQARASHGRGLAALDVPTEAAAHDHAHHTGESHQVNPTCGDEVTLGVVLDAGTIADLRWDSQGCSISQASLSVLTELVTGKPVDEAEQLGETFRALMASRGQGIDDTAADTLGDASAFVGVSKFPARIKCALLGWAALRDALARATTTPLKEDA